MDKAGDGLPDRPSRRARSDAPYPPLVPAQELAQLFPLFPLVVLLAGDAQRPGCRGRRHELARWPPIDCFSPVVPHAAPLPALPLFYYKQLKSYIRQPPPTPVVEGLTPLARDSSSTESRPTLLATDFENTPKANTGKKMGDPILGRPCKIYWCRDYLPGSVGSFAAFQPAMPSAMCLMLV